jgi:inhibitor of KinA
MVLVEFANEISRETHAAVYRLSMLLAEENIPGVIEWVPSYRSLGVIYDPMTIDYPALAKQLERLQGQGTPKLRQEAVLRRLEIPVTYGEEMGPDLLFVAEHHGLTIEQVIALHTSATYQVYLIGFTPGFPYLGGLPAALNTPRLANPRPRVPAGSVAIGGQQAGIYPVDSPGGWRILGRTPLRLFDLNSPTLCLLKIGDTITFRAISRDEFETCSSNL